MFVLATKQTLLSIVLVNHVLLRPISGPVGWIQWPHSQKLGEEPQPLTCPGPDVLKK